MLLNHILVRQTKEAWDDINIIINELNNNLKGLNNFLTCQLLKLTTFYSETNNNNNIHSNCNNLPCSSWADR